MAKKKKEPPKMRTVTVICEWRSRHRIEVPEDLVDFTNLSSFPEDALEQMSPDASAELVDWKVVR